MKTFLITLFIINFNVYSSTQNWEEVFSKDNIIVYASKTKSRIIPFKAVTHINSSLDDILATLKNYENKNLWSPKLKSVKLHKTLNGKDHIFSEFYKTPWPSIDREFLLRGNITRVSENKAILFARSIEDNLLENKDHIQADVKKIEIIIEYKPSIGSVVSFEFHGDMKGWMPAWLINIIQKKWPYRFLQSLKNRVENLNSV